MEAQSFHRPAFPTSLNLGSGKDFRDDCLNLDVDETWSPDAVCDLAAVGDIARGVSLHTERFGAITLTPGCVDTIIANDVLEHVPNLTAMMTTCLGLLRVGGLFQISVPYDLSFGAWQDPTHVRGFNERSWLYYTDWFWYMGWSDHRFALETFDFVPSPIGEELRARGVPRDEIIRTPRAIDSMSVGLRKVALSTTDRAAWSHWRDSKRAARATRSASVKAPSLVAQTTTKAVAAPATSVDTRTLRAFAGSLAEARDRYCLWIVSPEGYSHQNAYYDAALGLSEAFMELGGSAPIIRDLTHANGRKLIIFGPHLLPVMVEPTFFHSDGFRDLMAGSVLFNLEQADTNSVWMSDDYLGLLKHAPVVDYSMRNHLALKARGVTHVRHLPLGYSDGLTRFKPAAEQDIDVLFFGSQNERRLKILDALRSRGVKVENIYDVFGHDLDAVVRRAKIVINIHFFDISIFEAARVSYLLANGVCVVSEGDVSDPDIAPIAEGLAVAPYDGLVDRCLELIADDAQREALGRAGFDVFKRRRQAALLRSLFEA